MQGTTFYWEKISIGYSDKLKKGDDKPHMLPCKHMKTIGPVQIKLMTIHVQDVTNISTERLRACLVPYGMQNVNYFGVMKCKMPKFSGLYLVPSKMHNLLPSLWPLDALLGFFWPLEAKIQNGE